MLPTLPKEGLGRASGFCKDDDFRIWFSDLGLRGGGSGFPGLVSVAGPQLSVLAIAQQLGFSISPILPGR